jgi:hypothetical protein
MLSLEDLVSNYDISTLIFMNLNTLSKLHFSIINTNFKNMFYITALASIKKDAEDKIGSMIIKRINRDRVYRKINSLIIDNDIREHAIINEIIDKTYTVDYIFRSKEGRLGLLIEDFLNIFLDLDTNSVAYYTDLQRICDFYEAWFH